MLWLQLCDGFLEVNVCVCLSANQISSHRAMQRKRCNFYVQTNDEWQFIKWIGKWNSTESHCHIQNEAKKKINRAFLLLNFSNCSSISLVCHFLFWKTVSLVQWSICIATVFLYVILFLYSNHRNISHFVIGSVARVPCARTKYKLPNAYDECHSYRSVR